LIKSQRIFDHQSILNGTKVPRQQKIFQVLGSSIALNAPNGLRVNIVWARIGKGARTKEGQKIYFNLAKS